MRISKSDMKTVMETDDMSMKEEIWGDMQVGYNSTETEIDVGPLLKGLPNDMCQAPHWGYVFRGNIQIKYPDREENINAGDTFYIEPGHTGVIGAGTEWIEFSPEESARKTADAISRNFEAMSKE
jgi:hypothetical protein